MKSKNKPINESGPAYETIALILIWIGVFLIIFITILYILPQTRVFSQEIFGQWGENIGGIVGSLWALAGVTLFYEALRFQRTELIMQRHELELQRHEIIEQTEQQRVQNETLLVQTFENTFFQLMTLHNEIVEVISMEIKEADMETHGVTKRRISGRECFVEYYKLYKRFFHFSVEEIRTKDLDMNMAGELISSSYALFFEEAQANLGHYFRNLYSIIKFIDRNKLKEKKFHIELIRAQLSNYELLLLYFHCLSENGKDMKSPIEKYSLLSNLPHDELIEMTRALYNPTAFETV
jgi:hypothetical protein